MADVIVKQISDMDYYRGPHAIDGIQFRTAARELGVTAWGMSVIDMVPHCTGYPEHDHVKDGQEEVYVVLRGSAILVTGDERQVIEQGMMVRVGPGQKRKWEAGVDGVTLLAIGATPGKAYEPRR